MTPYRNDHKALVIDSDPLLAALVGALVERARLQAAFAQPGELAEQALARVRPIALVLVEARAPELSDIFLAKVRRRGVALFVFGSPTVMEERRQWASERDLPAFELPRDVAELQGAIERLPLRRQSGERRAARTTQPKKGELVFEDAGGTRWSVYDRRSRSRRVVERSFVRDDGTVYRCELTLREAASTSVTDLSTQLERAMHPHPQDR